jgi:hypothetical protein
MHQYPSLSPKKLKLRKEKDKTKGTKSLLITMNKEVGGKKPIADINTLAAKEAHSCKNLI